MKHLLFAFFLSLIIGCNQVAEKTEAELRAEDSLSKAKQSARVDSLKRSNPLLIAPPDSLYTGSYVDKYPNGITKFTGYFRFGKRHGQWLSFYPDGSAWSEMHYDKGLRHGPNITWFENGRKRFEGFYRDDRQDSVWRYYDSSGRLAEKVLYRNSRIVKRLERGE